MVVFENIFALQGGLCKTQLLVKIALIDARTEPWGSTQVNFKEHFYNNR